MKNKDSIKQQVFKNRYLKDLLNKLGIETYTSLVRSNKKQLLSPIINGKKTNFVGSPSIEWLNRNDDDLKFFKSHIKDSGQKFAFPDRKGRFTVTQEINKLIDSIENDDFYGILEDGEWSILNRLGTNYSNWVVMIEKRDSEGYLEGNNLESKIYEFFKQRPLDDEIFEFSPETIKNISRFTDTLSIAEVDIIFAILVLSKQETEEFEAIRNRIKSTTEKGEAVENKFVNFLKKNVINDLVNFSSYGNLVDITFQVDLMANINGTWIPIQVKSTKEDAEKSKIHKYNFGGIAVYPLKQKLQCGNWGYYMVQGNFKKNDSFDKDFLNLDCDTEEKTI